MQSRIIGGKRFLSAALLMGSLFVAVGLILATVSDALAHKVYLFAWVEGDTVHTESYFGSNRKVQGGKIEVFELTGKKLLEGLTNEEGEFAFKVPLEADLRIVVEASMGHKGEYLLKAEEVSGGVVSEKEQAKVEGVREASSSPVLVESQQIRTIVEEALDSRLKPIVRELAKSRKEKGPGLTEIIGGIGYIFGLMGVVMYFRSRKTR